MDCVAPHLRDQFLVLQFVVEPVQLERMYMARVLAAEVPLLLADEPVAALAPCTSTR